MDATCNSCGSINRVLKCQHCPTLLCARCKSHHEMTCAQNQKRRQLGLGPTVRRIDTTPKVPPIVDPQPEDVASDASEANQDIPSPL